jgi:hypothetical protein
MLANNGPNTYNYSIVIEKEEKMTGSIRVFVGLLVVLGSVGGIDTATDSQLLILIPIALVGLAIMASGVRAMNNPFNSKGM